MIGLTPMEDLTRILQLEKQINTTKMFFQLHQIYSKDLKTTLFKSLSPLSLLQLLKTALGLK